MIVDKIKQFLAAMAKNPVDAYRLQNTLTAAIEGFIKILLFGENYVTRNQDAEKQAIVSLQSWLFQINNIKEKLKSSEGVVVADDKKQGKLIYRSMPPLTVEEGRKTMDELRQGTPLSVTGITLPAQMQPKLAVSNQFEWGLGVIGSGDSTEAVIISGSRDATPFSEYPYMKPLAHTHPVKDYVKQLAGHRRALIHRQESCAVSDVLNNDKATFAVDLLPSKEDVDMTAKRRIPQTVYVNYKYDSAGSRIINPDVAANQPQPTNTSQMPWIDFVIGVPRKISERQEEVVLIMQANGQTVVRWKIMKNQSTYWWQND